MAILTNLNGTIENNLLFNKDVRAQNSCGVLFKGNFFIYGPDNSLGQYLISIVSDCALKKLRSLSFEFLHGACAATSNTIFLCFSRDMSKEQLDARTCRADTNSTFSSADLISLSSFTHNYIQIATSEGK